MGRWRVVAFRASIPFRGLGPCRSLIALLGLTTRLVAVRRCGLVSSVVLVAFMAPVTDIFNLPSERP
jgi:hypothetical protein